MSVPITRRSFVGTCAASAAVLSTTIPASLQALDAPTRRWLLPFHTDSESTLRDPRVRGLVNRALDAARSAGAEYADVRVMYTRWRKVNWGNVEGCDIALGFSVRTLVRGYWGWAVTPLLTETEAVRVAQTAVRNAQILTSHGSARVVEWLPMATVQEGDWTTPIDVDPFTLSRNEIASFLAGEMAYAGLRGAQWNYPLGLQASFFKTDHVFASTEGSYGIQTRYTTSCGATLSAKDGGAELLSTRSAQAGWEHVRDQPWRSGISALLAEMEFDRKLPTEQPLDVGRYDVVFGDDAMATLLGSTLGSALLLGRAIGSDAGTYGVSYLGPKVLSVLGTAIASPLFSLTGNRSQPKALATVPWDDEGVAPEDFPLITNGVLVDFLTTREQAPWLKTWYAKAGVAVRSRGCATSRNAHAVTREAAPNLVMRPSDQKQSIDDLIAGIGNGIVIPSLGVRRLDWQSLNGLIDFVRCYRVRNGKRVARMQYAQGGGGVRNAVMFRTPELLKSILAIGGADSLSWSEAQDLEGCRYSVATVPTAIKQVTIVDPSRRA